MYGTEVRKTFRQVPFAQVAIEDSFWTPRLVAHKNVTLQTCLFELALKGTIANFSRAGKIIEGTFFEGYFFDDSDLYKVIEGAAYSLMTSPDPLLETRIDRIIDLIVAAQEDDGYLMTYFTLEAPDQKWTEMGKHEMYCGGHLMEAAVAYKQATGKRKLLDVAIKLADHYDATFGPGKRYWVEGHEEIELALVKLYRETGEKRYRDLAKWLLEERGSGHGADESWYNPDQEFCQGNIPIREMEKAVGHAVRAMYLYAAMTDVTSCGHDPEGYADVLDRVWDNTVNKRMYVTGGVGSSRDNEGFTEDYDLPNDTAYCETCASIGLVLWSHRMNLLHGDASYADVMERAMFNSALAGVSLDGFRFFYVNPLASKGGHARSTWHGCACCPSNIARFIPSIGNYTYATGERSAVVNIYQQGSAKLKLGNGQSVRIVQRTEYPWEGRSKLTIYPAGDAADGSAFALLLRKPDWCGQATLLVNGYPVENITMEKGYMVVDRVWRDGDTVTVDLAMPVERVYAHPKVKANEGKVAIRRGPIVYCVEGVDFRQPLDELVLDRDTVLAGEKRDDLLGGVVVVSGGAADAGEGGFRAVPYYAWGNRELGGSMAVWINEVRPDRGIEAG